MKKYLTNTAHAVGEVRSVEPQGVTNSAPTNDFGGSNSYESSKLNNFGIGITILLAFIGFGLLITAIKHTFFPKRN